MQGILRFLQLLAMVIWAGGLIFFAFVLAPTAFHTLPTIHLAGSIVGASLKQFDSIALFCGNAFLVLTAVLYRTSSTRFHRRYALQFFFAGIMHLSTAYIQWTIIPAMDADESRVGGDISKADATNPAKLHFDTLHVRSERVEGFVLLLSLGVLFLISRDPEPVREITAR